VRIRYQELTPKYVPMTKVKESSTIQANKAFANNQCPITYVMDKIGGYWKPIILLQLLSGSKRYGELKREIPAITEKMLIQNLKQLEADKIISKQVKDVVPPQVTYSLTPSGLALRPVLFAMAIWAVEEGDISPAKDLSSFPGNS
jgi:DNA-binding HxlR family transcriptional regulator